MGPGSFQWCPAQLVQTKHRDFHTNMRKNSITVRVTALAQAAQSGCGVCFSEEIKTHLNSFLCHLL